MLAKRLLLYGIAILALAVTADRALALDYPIRAIKLIVPTPAGGPVDIMARLMAHALPVVLGQTVVVENRPGAGNTLGSMAAAAAKPDGYTLIYTAASGLIMSPMLHKNAGYDASSFAPVAIISEAPMVLVAHPSAPFKSVPELIAYARAHPGKLNYSTGGAGTLPHLTAELFKKLSATQITHVPYKGGGPALADVVAGQIHMTFDTVGTSFEFIREGKLLALALVGEKRLDRLPDVPAMPELGFSDLVTGAWTALLAPKGTSPEIIAVLNKACNETLRSPPMAEAFDRHGAQARGGDPEALAIVIRRDIAKWAPIVAALGLKAE